MRDLSTMCGITGYLNTHGEGAAHGAVEIMTQALFHRGPDAQSTYVDGPVALGHTRLSIIDVAAGHQPMHSDDGAFTVVFNGEIFNYPELKQELLANGGRSFRTHSDTEVILRLYEAYGPEMVERLNGDWAIAIWEHRLKRLFLSRDRVGVRPLHYAWFGSVFAFASEIKSLFAHPKSARELNPVTLGDVLTFWAPLPGETAFNGVNELPPGHSLIVDMSGQASLSQYWQWNYPLSYEPQSDPETLAEELLEQLTDAVRIRMRADVPVGAYLSGGIDSSLITSLLASLRTGDSDEPLETFSLAFEDPAYDESHYQNILAKKLGTRHHVVRCKAQDIGDAFEDVVWHAERPLLRTAPAPMRILSRLVKGRGFKVVMTGEGADEVFGGYDLFREAAARRFLARHPGLKVGPRLLRSLYPYMPEIGSQPGSFVNSFFEAGASDLKDPFYALRPRMRLTQGLFGLLSEDVRSLIAAQDKESRWFAHLPHRFDAWHPLDQAQYLEGTILMPGYILSSQGDRMAMASAVEGRFPFLDARVLAFAAQLPPAMRLLGLKEKWLLKKAAARLVPTAIASRPKQPYRAPDIPSLLRGQRSCGGALLDLLAPKTLKDAGIFNVSAVKTLVDRLITSRHPPRVRDAMALSAVLSVQILHDRFVAS